MTDPHLRAADTDRASTAEVLGGHLSAGRLTVAEFDERLAAAYAARTHGELARLTTDLPAVPAPVVPDAAVSPWDAWRGWLTVSVLLTVVWAMSSVGQGDLQPFWPVWAICPWGTMILMGSRGHGRPRHRRRSIA